jgi:hypothetical protein
MTWDCHVEVCLQLQKIYLSFLRLSISCPCVLIRGCNYKFGYEVRYMVANNLVLGYPTCNHHASLVHFILIFLLELFDRLLRAINMSYIYLNPTFRQHKFASHRAPQSTNVISYLYNLISRLFSRAQERASTPFLRDLPEPPMSTFQRLPSELLLSITDFLPPSDTASLALTSKSHLLLLHKTLNNPHSFYPENILLDTYEHRFHQALRLVKLYSERWDAVQWLTTQQPWRWYACIQCLAVHEKLATPPPASLFVSVAQRVWPASMPKCPPNWKAWEVVFYLTGEEERGTEDLEERNLKAVLDYGRVRRGRQDEEIMGFGFRRGRVSEIGRVKQKHLRERSRS